ncbi:helix-turn-helix domain-containing protein [Blautia schinkii]|nr:helix-turn-helix domain-containing protein [Blautia schinkii]
MTKKEIGAVLKQLRLSCNMKQKEVADIIGRNQQVVGHWETGVSHS